MLSAFIELSRWIVIYNHSIMLLYRGEGGQHALRAFTRNSKREDALRTLTLRPYLFFLFLRSHVLDIWHMEEIPRLEEKCYPE